MVEGSNPSPPAYRITDQHVNAMTHRLQNIGPEFYQLNSKYKYRKRYRSTHVNIGFFEFLESYNLQRNTNASGFTVVNNVTTYVNAEVAIVKTEWFHDRADNDYIIFSNNAKQLTDMAAALESLSFIVRPRRRVKT